MAWVAPLATVAIIPATPALAADFPTAPVTPAAAPARMRIVVQHSPLAGFQYYAGPRLWSQMKPGDLLSLTREADNPHDANAIRVDWQGEKLGYLPRAENRAVAAEMDRGGRLEARIADMQASSNPWLRMRIEVMVVF